MIVKVKRIIKNPDGTVEEIPADRNLEEIHEEPLQYVEFPIDEANPDDDQYDPMVQSSLSVLFTSWNKQEKQTCLAGTRFGKWAQPQNLNI